MKKKCKTCGLTKKATEFYKNTPWSTLMPSCKQCSREYAKSRYQEEKREIIKERDARRLRFEQLLIDIKSIHTYGRETIQRHVE